MNSDKNTLGTQQEQLDQAFIENVFSDKDKADNTEFDFPLIDTPANLSSKLYDISEDKPNQRSKTLRWIKPLSAAACLLFAVLLSVNTYNTHQERQAAIKAKQDLIIALSYLEKANQKTNTTLSKTLKGNIGQATVKPLIKSTLLLKYSS